MKIVLRWPDKRLTPNAKRRKHWRSYQGAANADREEARLITRSAMARQGKPDTGGEGKIPVVVRFYPPDRRHRDDDGMIGAFKHMRDGVADALAVNDRRFQPHYFFEEAEKPGRVEVVVCPQPSETFSEGTFLQAPAGAVTGMLPEQNGAT